MKLFDKYFQPYAEYCIRTTFSEDELKEALAQECPATSNILSWKAIKAAIGLSKTIVFSCDPDNPLCLHPLKAYRNTSRGDLFIRCDKNSGTETILHISIAQSGKHKYLLYAIGIFALFWGVAASFVIWWGIFLSVGFIGLVFIVLESCHAMAMDEVPQIRQDF
ncbi:MAG: hypothetical protein IJZ19_08990 [Lentisphaeria bacterium]|nr:hypothetical protein [Lentisphaeria bacterium]